jgi:hypothetical protein
MLRTLTIGKLSLADPFEIVGMADGILGRSLAGRLVSPYLMVVEAKRRIEAIDPIPQLYGQLLAAAYVNWQAIAQEPQEIFGCYTIADSWTFLRAEINQIGSDRPHLLVKYSREYTEKTEVATILKILKAIVSRKPIRSSEYRTSG